MTRWEIELDEMVLPDLSPDAAHAVSRLVEGRLTALVAGDEVTDHHRARPGSPEDLADRVARAVWTSVRRETEGPR